MRDFYIDELEKFQHHSNEKILLNIKEHKQALRVLYRDHRQLLDNCNQATMEMHRCYDEQKLLDFNPTQLSPERQPDGRLSSEKAAKMMKIAYDKGTHRFEWVLL